MRCMYVRGNYSHCTNTYFAIFDLPELNLHRLMTSIATMLGKSTTVLETAAATTLPFPLTHNAG